MFDARQYNGSQQRPPNSYPLRPGQATYQQSPDMTTAATTFSDNQPLSSGPAASITTTSPLPIATADDPLTYENFGFPRRSTSIKRTIPAHHFPTRSVSRGKARLPPPINTKHLAAWPLGPQSAAADDSGRQLWNGALRSARPRAGTSAGSDYSRPPLATPLFRTTSADSDAVDFQNEGLRRSQTDPLPPLTPQDIIKPSSAREHAIRSPIPSTPRLRDSRYVPDHRKARYAHPESSRIRPRLNLVMGSPSSSSFQTGSGYSPRQSPAAQTPSPDRYVGPVRESVKSNYTTTSSRADNSSLERSSTTTSMTSASDAWNANSAWNSRLNQEEISVEDYIALYAEGFEDDPPADGKAEQHTSPTKLQTAPWPMGVADADVPPVPKIDFAAARFHMPTTAMSSPPLTTHAKLMPPETVHEEPEPAPIPLTKDNVNAISPPPPPPGPKEEPAAAGEVESTNEATQDRRSFGDAESRYSKRSFDDMRDSKPMPEPVPARHSYEENADEYLDTLRQKMSEPEADANADRYGFKKDTRYVSLDQYEDWNSRYEDYIERRRVKWIELMRQHRLSTADPDYFPPRSDKIKRFIRKGIPPEWRGNAWFWYAGGTERLRDNRGLYEHLLYRAEQPGQLGEGDREHIERDLNRTFPDNDLFKRYTVADLGPRDRPSSALGSMYSQDELPERPMIQSLRRVLQCFAIYQPKIGYCQSLNFLAGMLLLFLKGNEEKSFHMLCILTSEHLPGTHGVALEGANVDISVLMTTLKDQMPALWAKLEDRSEGPNSPISPMLGKDGVAPRLPTVSLATTAWFMSVFVGTLPTETCCRVWDILFYEGSKTLFRVALGIFKLGEDEIRAVADPMEVFSLVQTLPRRMLDANELMEVSFGRGMEGRGLLSSGTVRRRREEKREIYQRERAVASNLMRSPSTPSVLDSSIASEDEPESKRGLSRGLSRLKSLTRKKHPPLPKIPA